MAGVMVKFRCVVSVIGGLGVWLMSLEVQVKHMC